ncbi:hypothetical protein KC19_VG166400 [Ceratodon purpureus]|uniref:Uncharacterized protein n=1 Tax=Ceratodon purpureus TaxID=3225 RepID=A0A8T0HRY5_CERPU|nr:hypothetical protein KC19_VG166400 [Ceratodon purpureus]
MSSAPSIVTLNLSIKWHPPLGWVWAPKACGDLSSLGAMAAPTPAASEWLRGFCSFVTFSDLASAESGCFLVALWRWGCCVWFGVCCSPGVSGERVRSRELVR